MPGDRRALGAIGCLPHQSAWHTWSCYAEHPRTSGLTFPQQRTGQQGKESGLDERDHEVSLRDKLSSAFTAVKGGSSPGAETYKKGRKS